jgi:hypothetical protein
MKRIDLNDVLVEREDSTIDVVPGRATIATQNADGHAMNRTLITAQPTGCGVDLPPAVYRVVTSYTHPADGTTVNFSEMLDLR